MANHVVVDRTQPNPYITALLKYKKSGKLLDLGAGHGRHAIYFAQQGFVVTAAEPSPGLCSVVLDRAKAADLQIAVIQATIDAFQSSSRYDVIVCAMVLHFLNQQEVQSAITMMKDLTMAGGLNVISAYTDQNKVGFMKDNPYGHEKYLLKLGELRNLYDGWNILEYSEDWTEPGVVNPDDIPTSYHKVNMIAQKK